ncbi:MAG: hypothetical protein ACXVIL_11835 [Halobacteriota archaeon]
MARTVWGPSFVDPRSRSGNTEMVQLSTLSIEPLQTHIYVI